MNNFRPVRKYKKERFAPSCKVSCSQHCAMDVILEEVYAMKDVNALVVGVGECAYYSRKMPFGEGRRNWAFQLTDNEIVFGDLSAIRAALEEISCEDMTTVCVITCIPSIMNLDIESVASKLRDTVVIKAPDFSGYSPYDIAGELYGCLAKGVSASENGGVTFWEGDFGSVKEFRSKLKSGTHVLNDRRYLTAVRNLRNVNVIDNTALHPLGFYRKNAALLGASESALKEAEGIVNKLRALNVPVSVKCARAYDFAHFLHEEGVPLAQIVFNGMNAYAYEKCAALPSDTEISADYGDVPARGYVFDLSPYDGEMLEKIGFERLIYLLKKAVMLCR